MGENFTHFLVCNLRFLEGSDEACNFVIAVALGTSSVECAGGLVIRFHNSLWAGDFEMLNPCVFPCGSCGGEFFLIFTLACWLQ